MTDWTGRTAAEIAAAVRAGETTASQVVGGHLDRIAKLNGELGAFIRVRAAEAASEAEAAGKRADLAELPLAGVPVAVKDTVPVAGEPMRVGSAALPDAPQGEDHPVVARLRAAGAVVVGLTNLPELGLVLVMPALARPCPPARRYGERSWLRSVATSLMFAPMTGIWNLAGFPAASVPVPAGGPGMPGAVQLVAAPGGEQALLALAAQLERAQPWPRHAPGYSGSLRPSWEASKPRDS